jgi:hypothetical protein
MKTFKSYLIEAKEQDGGLHMFDMDDTLFHTTDQIHVKDKFGNTKETLTNQEFNNHKLPKDHYYDFSEFKNAEKFHKEGEPIHPMINKLKAIHRNAEAKGAGSKVIINTARSDFDKKGVVAQKFKDHGIDINKVHIERAGNLPGDEPPAEKKAKIVRKYLANQPYKHVTLYDDSKKNLQTLLKMKKEYPNVKFHAYHVQPDGSTKKLNDDSN